MRDRMFDLLLTNATVATMADDSPFGLVRDGAIGIADGEIAWVGPATQAPRGPGPSAISPARS
jgi:imidazolonepropionase